MNTSVVFRVRNEGATLGAVLDGVLKQDCPDRPELVVVDSGSTDNTLDIARSRGCRIVSIPPEAFSWGYALNLGAREARGDIIIYLSGHCVPVDRRWLSTLLAPFSDGRVAGVYSRHQPVPALDPFEGVELEYLWFPKGGGSPVESQSFSNASCAIRRSVWEQIAFDETLLSCEDGDWAARVLKAGWRIIYQPASAVWHSHPPRLETIYLRWFWRCYAAKTALTFTRDGSWAYLIWKTLHFTLLDLRFLVSHGLLLRVWQLPFYEAVRQLGAFHGARAAMAGKKFDKWNDVGVPAYLEWFRTIVEHASKSASAPPPPSTAGRASRNPTSGEDT